MNGAELGLYNFGDPGMDVLMRWHLSWFYPARERMGEGTTDDGDGECKRNKCIRGEVNPAW